MRFGHSMVFMALAYVAVHCLSLTQVQAQEKRLVRNISIIGNKKTRVPYILREMDFAEGDSLAVDGLDQRLEQNRQNIFNIELFSSVTLEAETINEELYIIIEVKERWYIWPYPYLGLEERNTYDLFSNKNLHRLVYGGGIIWNNVSGRDDRIDCYVQFGFSKRVELEFIRPAIWWEQNADLLVNFQYVTEPEIIYGTDSAKVQWGETTTTNLRRRIEGKIGLKKRFTPRSDLTLQVGYHHFHFSDSIYVLAPTFITSDMGNEYYPAISLTFANDQRDYRSFPLNGYKLQLMFRQAGLPGWGTTSFSKLGFSWSQYLPLSTRWNLGYGLHNMMTIGKRVPFFEKNFVGIKTREFAGLSSNIRGYQRYAIDGGFVNMTKLEVKFALLPLQIVNIKAIPFDRFDEFPLGIYLTAFNDMGFVHDNSFNNEDPFLKDQLLMGYGIGLNIIGFYDNLLRIEYARNHLHEGGIYIHGSVSIK